MSSGTGPGMDQATARRRAKELGGVARSARRSTGADGGWHLGGWPSAADVWIVTALDGKTVLDDGVIPERPDLSEVGCPDCGAVAGERCRSPLTGGQAGGAHLERAVTHRMSAGDQVAAPVGPGCNGCPYYNGTGGLCVCGIARGRQRSAPKITVRQSLGEFYGAVNGTTVTGSFRTAADARNAARAWLGERAARNRGER